MQRSTVSNGVKDAAVTGTLGSVPLRRSGSQLGCQSLRLPAACSPPFGYRVQLHPATGGRIESSLQSGSARQFLRPVMDKFWSIFSMPIGVTLCFGPAVLVWWLTRDKESSSDKNEEKH
jgi:hypothetical protein